ncbi:MAG: 4Fe-4S binding protein [Desulfobacteraceae bacterium]|nr:4Fe-4S binding protein [Desulfobacteraceae bacterium]
MKRTRLVLSFPPESVEEPVTYRLITQHDLVVNILRATIDPGKQGRMVVELSGEERDFDSAYNYLEKLGVSIQPLTREIRYLEERCTSCTACLPVCPTAALDVDRDSWQVSYDVEKCVVCLSCVDACPYRAVEVPL